MGLTIYFTSYELSDRVLAGSFGFFPVTRETSSGCNDDVMDASFPAQRNARRLLGLRVQHVSEAQIRELVLERAAAQQGFLATYATAHTFVLARNWRFRQMLEPFDICFPDGFGVSVASVLLGQGTMPKTTANRFFMPLCEQAFKSGLSIALFGGRPGIADEVARQISSSADARLWISDGFVATQRVPRMIEELVSFSPNILFIAMGQPKQEQLALELKPRLPRTVIVCVGGLFDVIAGIIPNCPEVVRSAGMEWAFRLVTRPRQVWKRYLVGLPVLAAMIGKESVNRCSGVVANRLRTTRRPN
jgi:N-acetylglucosaminyldiphosphoundecaprenol N-acetyl-beta-D-mannosaminyltransferase